MKDYYSILGVNKNSDTKEIKKQYKKLAVKHHPDKGGDSENFKEICEAYEVLSNPEKKQQYDNPCFDFNFGQNFMNPDDIFNKFFSESLNFNDKLFNNILDLNDNFIKNQGSTYKRTSNVYINNGIQVEKTTEIINGVKKEYTKETDLKTGRIKNYS